MRRIGIIRTLRILLNEGMVISRANRRIADAQLSGNYWRHSTEELRSTLENIGFALDDVRAVYRGYSDLAYGHKPRGFDRRVLSFQMLCTIDPTSYVK